MISIKNKVFVVVLSFFFLVGVGMDAYYGKINYSAILLALMAGIALLQKPEFLLYALVVSIPWSIEYHFGEGFSIDFPDEPFMLLASGAALLLLIYRRKEIRWKVHPLLFIILLQVLWTIITVATSTDVFVSLKYLLAKTWFLLAFVALPLFLFKEETIIKRFSVLLLTSMMVAMLVALIRHGEYGWSFEKVNEALQPFFHNHIDYSALLVFTIPLQIAIIQLTKSARQKILIVCLLIITVVALYLSYSRGSWLALIAGIFTYWLIQKRMLLFGFLLFIFLSVVSVFWLKNNDRYLNYSNDYKTTIFHTNFSEHLIATYKLKDLSNAERIYRWVAGVRMIPDNWQTGIGPTTFYEQYKSYTVPAFKTYVSDNKEHSTVHNYFLLVLIEQGVIGALLFVSLLVFMFWYAQKVYHRSNQKLWKVVAATVASIMVMQCVINFLSDMIETDKVGSVFYLCIAALIVADIKTSRKRSDLPANVKRIS
ncbi:MAG TPA: O-antigen ligase family protein [Flavisolibacter sp.]|nr:O-antigen ligase family protein [Flavisolibacter sp.]